MKTMARIRLFLLKLNIIWNGGLAKPETWEQKEALEGIVNEN